MRVRTYIDPATTRKAEGKQQMSASPTVVLVHGAFADASGYGGIIHGLEGDYDVVAPPNPLRSLSGDAAALGSLVGAIDGPVLLVGHSYGGAVITQASASLPNVVGLVYMAAFGLAIGENCASAQEGYKPSLLSTSLAPTPYDAPGAVGGPDFYIQKEPFREVFCGDSSKHDAELMYATQRPLAGAAYTENATAAGWSAVPSWYLVSEGDNSIPPALQHFMAERMKATTDTINGSHTAFIPHHRTATKFIKQALSSL
jgi:pimeloyl-ACP methyl ester carboxylesterase